MGFTRLCPTYLVPAHVHAEKSEASVSGYRSDAEPLLLGRNRLVTPQNRLTDLSAQYVLLSLSFSWRATGKLRQGERPNVSKPVILLERHVAGRDDSSKKWRPSGCAKVMPPAPFRRFVRPPPNGPDGNKLSQLGPSEHILKKLRVRSSFSSSRTTSVTTAVAPQVRAASRSTPRSRFHAPV